MFKVILALFCVILTLQIRKVTSGELIYVPNFASLVDCDDFSNDDYKMENVSLSVDSSSADEVGVALCGTLVINLEIGDRHDISLAVSKYTENDKEYMLETRGNICGSLKNDDAPWKPLIDAMGISACPISVDIYKIMDLGLTLNAFSDVLNRDFCGGYEVELCVLVDMDKKACFLIGLEVVEVELDDK